MNDSRARTVALWVLLICGLAQMLADVLGLREVKAMAAATLISPAPKVFSAARGFETFSARYFLEWEGPRNTMGRLEFDHTLYLRLQGPYLRRNVYGAAFAYGPVLAADPAGERMLVQLAQYAFGGEAPLLQELGVRDEVRGFLWLRCEPATDTPELGLPWVFLRYPIPIAQ